MTSTALLDAAVGWHTAGAAVLPVRDDGTKAPAVATWRDYQTTAPGIDQVIDWATAASGIGLICGAVSGGLEMLELEGRAVEAGMLTRLRELADDNGLRELLDRVADGYSELTPSGGLHLLYRVVDEHGQPAARKNTKLARRIVDGKIEVLAETRGEGGFVVIAPSNGSTHATGKPWRLITGGADRLAVLTPDERDALYALVSLLDQMPAAEPLGMRTGVAPGEDGRPGDDYNARATWEEILGSRGWTKVRRMGAGFAWRRPGKNVGISATTGTAGDGVDRLYVFSTSTAFEAENPYSKFAAYALLEHGGDHKAAATTLRAKGYGSPRSAEPGAGSVGALEDLIAPQPQPSAAGEPPQAPVITVVAAPPGGYTQTDDGNALRLVDTYASLIRYVPERGSWLAWDGSRWESDAAELIREHARSVARALPVETASDRRHAVRSLNAIGVSGMLRLAQSDPRIVARAADLDAQPYELNTPGGVLDLRTATLRSPDPAALHTRSTAFTPEFGSEPTHWLAFLADTFAGDPALITYVQRLLGQSLIGLVLEQLLPFCYGDGANGKSTLLGVVQRVVGMGEGGYSTSAPAELLLMSRNTEHPTEIARLTGARLVVTSELEDGQRFAEAKVKLLTGGDSLTARFMHHDYFTFRPTHSLWLLGNHQPTVRSGGPAFWRRLRLIPFVHTVPPEDRIADLEDRLVAEEGPAILAWLAIGAADYLNSGLGTPDGVIAATDAYAKDQDTVSRFVEDECITGPVNRADLRCKVTELRAAYEHFCRVEGETPVTSKTFTTTLRARFGVESDRDRQSRYYSGIRLKQQADGGDGFAENLSQADEPDEWWQR